MLEEGIEGERCIPSEGMANITNVMDRVDGSSRRPTTSAPTGATVVHIVPAMVPIKMAKNIKTP